MWAWLKTWWMGVWNPLQLVVVVRELRQTEYSVIAKADWEVRRRFGKVAVAAGTVEHTVPAHYQIARIDSHVQEVLYTQSLLAAEKKLAQDALFACVGKRIKPLSVKQYNASRLSHPEVRVNVGKEKNKFPV